MTERVEWESFQHGPQHDCFTEHPNSPCSNERVEEIRRQVGYWIKCAAYNQPLMGVEWERSENQRWLDVADKIIELCATALAQAERDSLCHHCGTHNARLHCQHCGRHLAFPNRPSYDDQALTLAQAEREREEDTQAFNAEIMGHLHTIEGLREEVTVFKEKIAIADEAYLQAERDVQTWKDMGEKEHALAVQFAKEKEQAERERENCKENLANALRAVIKELETGESHGR